MKRAELGKEGEGGLGKGLFGELGGLGGLGGTAVKERGLGLGTWRPLKEAREFFVKRVT